MTFNLLSLNKMRLNIEKRLHRVKIELDRKNVKCSYSNTCDMAENCERCNSFYRKCNKFKDYSTKSTFI